MMWKKSEPEESHPQPAPAPAAPAAVASKSPVSQAKDQAVIGSTISIKGDLTGEEDLAIEGRFEGKIELKRNRIAIGKSGYIKGDIYGKIITIEGTVEGNLYGEEQLILRQSGNVRGNIIAPRVALEDGSKFIGSIDMSSKEKTAAPAAPEKPAASVKAN